MYQRRATAWREAVQRGDLTRDRVDQDAPDYVKAAYDDSPAAPRKRKRRRRRRKRSQQVQRPAERGEERDNRQKQKQKRRGRDNGHSR